MFSYYKSPIKNKIPYKAIGLSDIYNAITSNVYKEKTKKGRELLKSEGKEAYRAFKAQAFDYVTFSGTFTQRHTKHLISHSGLICLDIDHQHNLSALKRNIIKEPFLETQLIFTSPSNDGLKVVVNNPFPEEAFSTSFNKVKQYFEKRYGRAVDSTPDVARACFVCYDPDAWMKGGIIPREEYLNGLSLGYNPITKSPELMHEGYPAIWDETAPYLENKTKQLLRIANKNHAALKLINNLKLN